MKKNFKKLFLLMAVVMTAMVCLAFEAGAANIGEGTCGENASWVLDDKGTLTISGSGAITKNPWEDYSLIIKNLVIKEGITAIRVSFSDFGAIKSISLPNGLERIGEQAFYGCVSLKSIDIPDTVTQIDNYAFSNCDSLTEVTIPASVVSWNWGAFYDCDALKKAVFEEGALTVPKSIFDGCGSLQEVVLPESITSIESEAFANSSITAINIPSNVTRIGDMAFYQCYSLNSVYIKDLNAYCNIEFVHSWSIGGNPLTYGREAVLYLNGKPVTDLNIPDTITQVNDYAFYCYNSLKSVTISGNTKIGKDAFKYCENLEEATLKEGIMVIDNNTFNGCEKLKCVRLPKSLITIATDAFYGTEGLKTVEYAGTKEEWNEIVILPGNETLVTAYEHKHNYVLSDTVSATCTKAGTKTYTCECEDSYIETVEKLGHNYSSKFTTDKKATCTTEGSKSKHCTRSGCTAKSSVTATPKLAHTYKTTTTKATLKKNGKQVTKCTVCGNVSKTTTVYYPKTIKLSYTSTTYNGKTKKPTVTVKDSKGNTLKKDTDYTVQYASGRKNPGKYTVTVTFKGKYSGTKKLSFTIKPATVTLSKVTAGSKQLTANWKTVSGVTGYEVQASTSSKFTSKTTKKVTIKSAKTKKTTIKKLKKGKKYYVKVRAYKTVSGKKIYGTWSSVKSVKVK